ncbi:hypothetical protein CCHOA_01240 [Corynebacterium choanae]|uniref:Uncharacterized protein n=1 Tax=Corynebacterium choanae TaxID=1862358 RepID=A0A3G6J406_9CORY|nr:hypothetical protein CCHOA_01240 [Corynebacterium choanae]
MFLHQPHRGMNFAQLALCPELVTERVRNSQANYLAPWAMPYDNGSGSHSASGSGCTNGKVTDCDAYDLARRVHCSDKHLAVPLLATAPLGETKKTYKLLVYSTPAKETA